MFVEKGDVLFLIISTLIYFFDAASAVVMFALNVCTPVDNP